MSATTRGEIIAIARTIAEERLVVGTVGNVSFRLDDRVLITPSRVPYARMRPSDIVTVSLTGERLAGSRQASIELPLHLAVYRRRGDVRALIHTHSPHATAWSFLGEPLPRTEENAYYGIGEVLTTPAAPSGSIELAEAAATTLGDSSAVLLGRHGVLVAGLGLEEALELATVVEHQAQVALLLRSRTEPGVVEKPAYEVKGALGRD
ncbi:MAG: class II aldolase/adducin family protein [Solirubrobacterales bacterium]